MAFVRHLKVTIKRAKNINACTTTKARTIVTGKASYKNVVYTTSRVKDMGQNPVWDHNDGTNEFHFDFKDESEFITLELFNRKNEFIGESKLHFSELANLPPGKSEAKTLPVMVTPQKQFGELVLMVEIEEQQAMGELGLLTVELRKGMIQKITSIIFGSRTTNISAKLIYKHTTYTSGILENMGNIFVWDADNTFNFIINSFKTEDVLRVEVYNLQAKVGECEMLVSLFIQQEENLRADRIELVARSMDLSLAKRAPVGNIEVATKFTKPSCRRTSLPQAHLLTSHYAQSNASTAHYYSPTSSQLTHLYPPQPGYSPPGPQFDLSSFNQRASASAPVLYPPGAHLNSLTSFNQRSSPELYPPGPHFNPSTSLDPRRSLPTYLHPSAPDQSNLHSHSPSAPAYPEVVDHHSRRASDTALRSQGFQEAHGAPAGREKPVYRDPDFEAFMRNYHP